MASSGLAAGLFNFVAHIAHSFNAGATFAQFLAQSFNVHIHSAAFALKIGAPNLIHNPFTTKHNAAV